MRRFPLMVAVALLVTACGGSAVADRAAAEVAEQIAEEAGGGQIDIETSDEGDVTLKVEGEDGSVVVAGGGLPDDFPFPLPDEYTVGMNIRQDGSSGPEFLAVIQVPGNDVDALAGMYVSWLESEGFDVEQTVIQGDDGMKMVFIAGERSGDGIIASVDLSSEEVANDDEGNLTYATVVSFSWAPSGE